MSTINANLQAIAGARNLKQSQEMLDRSLNRLSSGSKIVSPSDDAAGLAVSKKMDAQSRRVKAAMVNVQNAISYVQTSDGYLAGMAKILGRMSELAILTTDSSKNASDVDLYGEEFVELQRQLRETIGGTTADIGGTTDIDRPLGSYNGMSLFGRTSGGGMTVTIGDVIQQTMLIRDTDLRAGAMFDVISQDPSGAFNLDVSDPDVVSTLTGAIELLAEQRASLGASQSRLELASGTLQVESENLAAAISRIRDVDVADESTQLARYQVLTQSGTAMLAQANQAPQSVLKLLQNI